MRSSTSDLAILTLLAAGVAYFLVDGWFGPSGSRNIAALETAIAKERVEIADLEKKRDALKRKTAALSGETVDAELFEEAARRAFGVARPDEHLILSPDR